MFISLLPRKVENPELRRILRGYFRIRSEKVRVEESITVYKDAAERFGEYIFPCNASPYKKITYQTRFTLFLPKYLK